MTDVVSTELEVRWGECDPAGIVYHPAYIDWFSVARMHLLSAHGVSYMTAFHNNGVVLVVLEVNCRYHRSLRAEDKVQIDCSVEMLSRTRMSLKYEVYDANDILCAAGRTEHAFTDLQNRAINLAKHSPELWKLLQKIAPAVSLEV